MLTKLKTPASAYIISICSIRIVLFVTCAYLPEQGISMHNFLKILLSQDLFLMEFGTFQCCALFRKLHKFYPTTPDCQFQLTFMSLKVKPSISAILRAV